MEERIAVTLDFTACKYISEVYGEMRTKMDWCEFFGENLDALWDIFTGMPYKGDDFTIIRPVKFENIPYGQNDIFTEHVDKICAIFERAQQRYGDITVKICCVDSQKKDLSSYSI